MKLAPLLLPLIALGLGGCVSTKYKMAKPQATPPAVTLNLGNTPAAADAPAPALAATLHTVIVYQGPGSWKREAYWDEYVVTVVNRSDKPVTIESASLTDFQGQTSAPGDNPWALENQSHDYAL